MTTYMRSHPHMWWVRERHSGQATVRNLSKELSNATMTNKQILSILIHRRVSRLVYFVRLYTVLELPIPLVSQIDRRNFNWKSSCNGFNLRSCDVARHTFWSYQLSVSVFALYNPPICLLNTALWCTSNSHSLLHGNLSYGGIADPEVGFTWPLLINTFPICLSLLWQHATPYLIRWY